MDINKRVSNVVVTACRANTGSVKMDSPKATSANMFGFLTPTHVSVEASISVSDVRDISRLKKQYRQCLFSKPPT